MEYYELSFTNKPIMQAQIRQNAELPDAKSDPELDAEEEELRLSIAMTDAKNAKLVDPLYTRLSFTIDKDTNETIISVIDNKSGEIIRQIPPDEILNIKRRMIEIHGILFDRKA